MSVGRPHPLTVRVFVDGQYTEGGRSRYIEHPRYSRTPRRYVRAFEILQKDLLELFEYIEPSRYNKDTYSLRIYGLFLRTCTEIEANFKSILKANTFTKKGDWSMPDYFNVNKTHYLSEYKVRIPFWDSLEKERQPYKAWRSKQFTALRWYDAYNKVKHDRGDSLHLASFDNLIEAFCGLVVLLSAQFLNNDLAPGANSLVDEGPNDGFEDALGGYFRVRLPSKIPASECYEFDWQDLDAKYKNPFQKIDYDSL